jgi:LacI family transcriptional regulator
MAITLKDIAKRAGVTSATVSMVVNNKPNISAATREKVLAIAHELNYYPNVIARGLATRRTNAIGIIVPNLASSFVVRVLQGIKSTIREIDYTVLLFDTIGQKQSEVDVFNRVIREGRVDGAIIISANAHDDDLKIFSNEDLHSIVVARKSEVIDSVYVNNELASMEATMYLIEKGHSRIALIVDEGRSFLMQDRVAGYKRALQENSLQFNEHLVLPVEDDAVTAGADVVTKLLAIEPRPTAVFCPVGDMAAIGIIKELRKRNLSVPQDFAVVGYDDIPAAEVIEPALTTVRQPKLEMGDFAISTLVDKIEGREKGIKSKELLAKLIVRESA